MLEVKPGNARILQNTADSIQATFYVDGVATAGDSAPTVTVTRADGTAVLTAVATTAVADTPGAYKRDLTVVQTEDLELFKAVWTYTKDGTAHRFTTYHEVVGGFLFTEYDARQYDNAAMASTTTYPSAKLREYRDLVTDRLEEATGTSWVPRFKRVELSGEGTTKLALPSSDIYRIQSVTVDGTALTSSELDDLVIDADNGTLERDTLGSWVTGHRNVVVEYEYGKRQIEDGADRIGLMWLRKLLVPSNIPDQVSGYTDEGGNSYRLGVPSARRPSGVFEVDAWIASRQNPVVA